MSNNEILKPCPFCGTDDQLEVWNTHTAIYTVACENCDVRKSGEYLPDENETSWCGGYDTPMPENYKRAGQSAIDGWNKRAGGGNDRS